MSDRRTFIHRAVALALVAAVPALPIDDWDLFLSHIRERLIKLARDGYQIKSLEISPDHDGQRLVRVRVNRECSIVQSVVWRQKSGAR